MVSRALLCARAGHDDAVDLAAAGEQLEGPAIDDVLQRCEAISAEPAQPAGRGARGGQVPDKDHLLAVLVVCISWQICHACINCYTHGGGPHLSLKISTRQCSLTGAVSEGGVTHASNKECDLVTAFMGSQ